MLDYTPNRPDWYYSYVDIPNLEKIQEELLYVREYISPSIQNQAHYSNYFTDDVVKYIPAVCEYLKDNGLYDKLYRVMFSSKKLPGFPIQSGIHVDNLDKRFTYSLNIPLVDCENTYTSWYNGPLRLYDHSINPFVQPTENPANHFGVLDDHLATEVCRVETVRPMVINTTIPHRGLTTRPYRVISCLRFIPDLTDEEFDRITK